MSSYCGLCDGEFIRDEALQQHVRDSSMHKFDCTTCDRHFGSDETLAQHFQNAAVHARSFKRSTLLAMPPRKQKPTTKQKPSMKPKSINGRCTPRSTMTFPTFFTETNSSLACTRRTMKLHARTVTIRLLWVDLLVSGCLDKQANSYHYPKIFKRAIQCKGVLSIL